jgi:hypothetical protein
MIKIIANKKMEITADEYRIYEEICSSHDPGGKELFKGLFETDEEGMIVCLIPPQKRFSFDVICFLQNLMLHQHLRKIYKEHDEALKEFRDALAELRKHD